MKEGFLFGGLSPPNKKSHSSALLTFRFSKFC
jgi:hypothetical protein